MARVSWSKKAIGRVTQYTDYIARDSPADGNKWARKLLRSTRILSKLPEIGSPVEEFPGFDLRELIVGPFRVIYRYRKGTCRVAIVVRAEQDIFRHFDPTTPDE
ncbi:MAG TPA: type II toxin-antitoxin system RelE/ParE family toxin [Fimbriiglobus sp.]|jgi:plasmid stabilization system protein ParE